MEKINAVRMGRENKKIVLDIVRRYPGITRKEISDMTDMDPSTVSKIVSNLLDDGYVVEGERKYLGKRGRRAIGLQVNPDVVRGIVVTVGAEISNIGISKFDGSFEILDVFRTFCDFEEFVESVRKRIISILENSGGNIVGISMSIPGIVDMEKGIIRNAPHLKWKEKNLKEKLNDILESYNLFLIMDNEAKLSLYAESWYNEEIKNLKNGLYVYQSEGVGGALMIDGKVYRGGDFIAGEIGHMVIDPNGRSCHCGRKGCWETFISTEAIVQSYEFMYGKLEGDNFNEKFMKLMSRKGEEISWILDKMVNYITIGLLNLLNIIDPQFVILGGTMYNFSSDLIKKIRERISSNLLSSTMDSIKIIKASMDMDTSRMKGCSLTFVDKFISVMMG